MVIQFVEFLFRDWGVTKIQTDPAPINLRAIRCYEKVGFRKVAIVDTPDGPALLMVIEHNPKPLRSDTSLNQIAALRYGDRCLSLTGDVDFLDNPLERQEYHHEFGDRHTGACWPA